jgi:long-chain fatty acid transport protein
VKSHNGFNGALGSPGSMSSVQGKSLPTYYYESFRIIGFPAIVENHITAGIGYEFTPKFAVNLAFMHAFQKTISESGTNLIGQPVTFQSSLNENSLDFGFTWRF